MTYKVEAVVSEYPSGLKTAEQVSAEIGLSVERLIKLADGGFAPHYRVDGGAPLFRVSDFKKWAARNLVERIEGRELPEPVKIGLSLAQLKAARKMPECLREVKGLYDITGEYNRSGIYFLCQEDELQYVGQSVNVHSRVGQHNKKHNQVLFLPWPADDLDRIEGALIRYLKPPLNGRGNRTQGGICAPAEAYQGADMEILEHIRDVAC